MPVKCGNSPLRAPCVVTLDIARLANINRRIDKNFDKLPVFHQGASLCSFCTKRGDDGDNGDQTRRPP